MISIDEDFNLDLAIQEAIRFWRNPRQEEEEEELDPTPLHLAKDAVVLLAANYPTVHGIELYLHPGKVQLYFQYKHVSVQALIPVSRLTTRIKAMETISDLFKIETSAIETTGR